MIEKPPPSSFKPFTMPSLFGGSFPQWSQVYGAFRGDGSCAGLSPTPPTHRLTNSGPAWTAPSFLQAIATSSPYLRVMLRAAMFPPNEVLRLRLYEACLRLLNVR